jgi:SAM-dependent methyltransferase
MSLTQTFTQIYKDNSWDSSESVSGTGSEMKNTEVIRRELPVLLDKFNITSILDIPCGDWNWMKTVNLNNTSYIGADIVPDLIEKNKSLYPTVDFRVLDLTSSELPKVDLIFTRDCLGHLSNENVFKAIQNCKASGSKYLLATSFTKWNTNSDIHDGYWKCINLMVEPFLLNPLYLINEDCRENYPHFNDKCMVLFQLNP